MGFLLFLLLLKSNFNLQWSDKIQGLNSFCFVSFETYFLAEYIAHFGEGYTWYWKEGIFFLGGWNILWYLSGKNLWVIISTSSIIFLLIFVEITCLLVRVDCWCLLLLLWDLSFSILFINVCALIFGALTFRMINYVCGFFSFDKY